MLNEDIEREKAISELIRISEEFDDIPIPIKNIDESYFGPPSEYELSLFDDNIFDDCDEMTESKDNDINNIRPGDVVFGHPKAKNYLAKIGPHRMFVVKNAYPNQITGLILSSDISKSNLKNNLRYANNISIDDTSSIYINSVLDNTQGFINVSDEVEISLTFDKNHKYRKIGSCKSDFITMINHCRLNIRNNISNADIHWINGGWRRQDTQQDGLIKSN